MTSRKPTLASQELEIMKVVWRLESATVRQVYEALLERRHIAYTTVMTTMNILEQKGFLTKQQENRAYIYRSTAPQKQVVRSMVREFVDRVFNGSAEPLLLHLVEDQQVTEEELDEVRKMIRASASVGRKGRSK